MMAESTDWEEATRLERLWAGQFGDAYTERNRDTCDGRRPFWHMIFTGCAIGRVLEVGCSIGANLQSIAQLIPGRKVYGVDVNERALKELRIGLTGLSAVRARALALPFRDGWFDLVFTTCVLIHQPPEALQQVMAEIVRCSRRYVLCGEYYAEVPTEIPYRGQTRALFKRDFGGLYQQLFPDLVLLKNGFLPKSKEWDDVTYWLFEKPH